MGADDDAANWLPGGLTPEERTRLRAEIDRLAERNKLERAQMEASGGVLKYTGPGNIPSFGPYAMTDPEAHFGKAKAVQLKKKLNRNVG